MTEVRDLALHFEGVKVAMRQSKDGTMITFSIHPNEVPAALLSDLIGSRYQLALVKLDEFDQPEERERSPGEKAVAMAGLLAENADFQRWMALKGYASDVSPEACKEGLRAALGVESRKELKDNEEARQTLFGIAREFKVSIGGRGS